MQSDIVELTHEELDAINGGTVFGTIAAAMGGASVIAAGAAMVPTPASPALGAFAVVTGVLGAGAAYIDSNYK
jgi:hypothetical protein